MNIFSPGVLTAAINSMVGAPTHLLELYFPFVTMDESEEIHFDLIDKTRRLAPFVSPVLAGKIVDAQGYRTATFKPAYIKPKTPLDPSRPIKRLAGEGFAAPLSAAQRVQALVANILEDHDEMVKRRLEAMASEALRTGKVTVTGDGYGTVVVDFGRDASLTKTLAAGARWGDANVSVRDNLQTWAQLVLRKSGVMPNVVSMDVDAWNVFRKDPGVETTLDLRNNAAAVLNTGAALQEGGVYMGKIDGFDIWVVSEWYLDDAGVEQPILPSGSVIMSNGRGLQGTRAYAAIRDEEAGYQAFPIFTKSWVEKDPSVRYVLSQSAPLIVPTRANASLYAKVLA